MRALLAEYTAAHDPALAPEGAAMAKVLEQSFTATGYEVVQPEQGDFLEEIRRIAPTCDIGLVIAPDELLPDFTRAMEGGTHNIGCGSVNAAFCANKRLTARILASHGIPVPAEIREGVRVLKPALGCGACGVRLSDSVPAEGEIAQQFIPGDHLSVSLICSRVVGEVCLYYTGNPPLFLTLNQQDIVIRDGKFSYLGGCTPLHHPREDEIIGVAGHAATVMGCQGYVGVDVVVGDRVYVVDINPRITTSIVGIAHIMEEEIADLMIRASRGEDLPPVHLHGKVRFNRIGQVVPV
jgi:predicted ATP-grasp superfamily ATP-dependent carboligase